MKYKITRQVCQYAEESVTVEAPDKYTACNLAYDIFIDGSDDPEKDQYSLELQNEGQWEAVDFSELEVQELND